ncbi:MAG: hypothetical protein MPN21_01515, partial [Thermoanaerobaculia bacterium]|nr:hypothetical protein [Thermoanaerobaculia bacterium]
GKVLLEATTGEPAPTHDDDGSVDTDLVAFQAVAKTDPILHRVIDTCLREQPSDRPTSAALIVRALESADPLDAILVLGEHPSPNMIQASRARGLLNPRTGSWVFVGALALAAALMALRPHVESMEVAGLGSPPEQRVETVRTLLNAVVPERDDGRALWGYTEIDVHRLPGVPYPRGLVRSGDDVMFWYREAMDLANLNAIDLVANGGRVSFFQPDRNEWGSTTVALDPQGRLFHFQYTPLPNTPEGSQGEPDWARFFEAADLDPRRMREVDLQLPLPVASDRRSTWRGQLEGRSTLVEAASLGRTPTLFLVLQTATEQDGDSGIYARQDAAYQIVYFAAAALLVVLAVPAARNLRAGRGDPWGAFKLAVIILIVTFASFLSQADHRVSPADEAIFVLLGLAGSLLKALGVWLLYMAIEPIVQQYWPRALVSWSRVLHGRQTDPIVASHLLLGLALGAAFAVLRELEILAVGLTAGAELPLPHSLPLALPELRHGFGALLNAPFEGVFSALLLLAVLAACRLVLKFPPAAFLAAVALFSLQPLLSSPSPAATVLFYSLATTTIGIRVVTHYGLATYVVAQTVVEIFRQFPLTADPNSWYLGSTATALGVFLAAGFVAILRLTTHDPRPL